MRQARLVALVVLLLVPAVYLPAATPPERTTSPVSFESQAYEGGSSGGGPGVAGPATFLLPSTLLEASLARTFDSLLAAAASGDDPQVEPSGLSPRRRAVQGLGCPPPDACHGPGVYDTSLARCIYPLKPDGTQCSDFDRCTEIDVCIAGVCVGSDPVVCEAADSCHEAGVCDPQTGRCSTPALADGTACDDGNACSRSDVCQRGVCVGGDVVTCDPPDQCHSAGRCDPDTGSCSYQPKRNGLACDDQSVCTTADVCRDGTCVGTAISCDDSNLCTTDSCDAQDGCLHSAVSCDDANPCTTDSCVPATGCGHANNTNACDDGDECTRSDVCSGGACVGGDPLICTPLDQCHDAGTCDPATGNCSTPAKADETPCDDGDACTTGEACHSGTCDGGTVRNCTDNNPCTDDSCDPVRGCFHTPVVCDDHDACTMDFCAPNVGCVNVHTSVCEDFNPCTEDSCDSATGCVHTRVPDGTACEDGDACTAHDSCQSGLCTSGPPPNCNDDNACTVDSCAEGLCLHEPADCDDHNACTVDVCDAVAGCRHSPRNCDDADACTVDSCDPSAGCVHSVLACSDNDACTADRCDPRLGCVYPPVSCNDGNPCTDDSCDPVDGCQNVNNTISCNDGNACTVGDACSGGVCVAGAPRLCPGDECHFDGVCNTDTGLCLNRPKVDGTACNDGNACTQTDSCIGGSCAGANPVICVASDQCHDAGTCDPSTGNCSNPARINGSSCDDSNACTTSDSCQAGVCSGGPPPLCPGSTIISVDGCMQGSCDPAVGCQLVPKADGSPCNDGNGCTQSDSCQKGACAGANPVVCLALDQCHDAGTCDPSTGACSNPSKANGTSCNDLNACNGDDICVDGECSGGPSNCDDLVDCTIDYCDQDIGCFHDPISCDDGNPCTDDRCDPNSLDGCTHLPNSDSCDDGNACTENDTCLDRVCTGGAAPDCDDGNVCTTDSCDTLLGCLHEPIVCNDNDSCTIDDCGAEGCVYRTPNESPVADPGPPTGPSSLPGAGSALGAVSAGIFEGYYAVLGQSLQLDGSGSSDPDSACGDSIASYQWLVGGTVEGAGAPIQIFSYEYSSTVPPEALAILGPGEWNIALYVQDERGAIGYGATLLQLLPAYYLDGDDDGFGDPLSPSVAPNFGDVYPPSGYIEDNTDCDDTNAAVHPGAEEVCNGTDDDCDLTTDEGASCDDSDACTADSCVDGVCVHDFVCGDGTVAPTTGTTRKRAVGGRN